MALVPPFNQTVEQARRTDTWRRPVHRWRGRQLDTMELLRELSHDAKGRRRRAICVLMDEADVPNTAQAHRRAYSRLWTDRVSRQLGSPPRPEALVRWRRRLAEQRAGSVHVFAAHLPTGVRP